MNLKTCKKCGNLLGIAEKDYCGQCKPEVDEEALDEILLKQIIESRGKKWIYRRLYEIFIQECKDADIALPKPFENIMSTRAEVEQQNRDIAEKYRKKYNRDIDY